MLLLLQISFMAVCVFCTAFGIVWGAMEAVERIDQPRNLRGARR